MASDSEPQHSPEPLRDPSSMTLVEIAEELEAAASRIETSRAVEREARARYQATADECIEHIERIKTRIAALVAEQHRKTSPIDGLSRNADAAGSMVEAKTGGSLPPRQGPVRTLADAILRVWDQTPEPEPLTTAQILDLLPSVGYRSRAAPKSLKSSLNQVIAKLCQSGELVKFRSDGTRLESDGEGVRARKYLSRRWAETRS